MSTLAERLGYSADDRLLIINCDDLGMCHSANEGVYEALRSGIATAASLMVPCPWAREAASHYRGEDIGVHLTLTAEFELYRWGPCTQAPSLEGGQAGFPATIADVWEHADLDETRRELRAQIERAILWGFDVTHLDCHMGVLQLRPEFFDLYLDLAVEFALPLRLSGRSTQDKIGFPFRDLAEEEGIVVPDHLVVYSGVGGRRPFERTLMDLRPGVTEVYLHPATDHSEIRSFAPDWADRVDDHHMLTRDSQVSAVLERSEVHLIGWRELRDLQRTG
ncbi:MAG: polysaccharide deacetylase family protein [Acidimicrobiales bacterium]